MLVVSFYFDKSKIASAYNFGLEASNIRNLCHYLASLSEIHDDSVMVKYFSIFSVFSHLIFLQKS